MLSQKFITSNGIKSATLMALFYGISVLCKKKPKTKLVIYQKKKGKVYFISRLFENLPNAYPHSFCPGSVHSVGLVQ
jgi:hypothetical protein